MRDGATVLDPSTGRAGTSGQVNDKKDYMKDATKCGLVKTAPVFVTGSKCADSTACQTKCQGQGGKSIAWKTVNGDGTCNCDGKDLCDSGRRLSPPTCEPTPQTR